MITTSTKVPFWGDTPQVWDRVKIADLTLPGTCQISGSIARKVDSAKTPGKDGKTSTHLAYDGAKFDVTIFMWEEVHLAKFMEIAGKLRPRKGEPAKPVTIYHPTLEAYGIRACELMELGFIEDGPQDGVKQVKIHFEEYIPDTQRSDVTKATAKAKGAAKPAVKAPVKPTPAAAVKPSTAPPAPSFGALTPIDI